MRDFIYPTLFFIRSSDDTDSTGSIMAIKNALERLDQQRIDLEDLWSTRKIYLDLFLRFKFFERDALAVSIIFSFFFNKLYFLNILKLGFVTDGVVG